MKRTIDLSDEAERDLGDCMAEALLSGPRDKPAETSVVGAIEEALRRMAATSIARQARTIRKATAK